MGRRSVRRRWLPVPLRCGGYWLGLRWMIPPASRHTGRSFWIAAQEAGRQWRILLGWCWRMAGRLSTVIILPPTAAPADGAARFGARTIPIMCIRTIRGTWPPAWKGRRRPAMVWECRRWAVCGRRSKGFLIMRYWRFIMAAQSLYGSTAGAALFLLEKIWKEWMACIYMS